MQAAVYGVPPPVLSAAPAGAAVYSPFLVGAPDIEALGEAGLDFFEVLAPPGVLERRYVLAQVLRALRPGGQLVAMAPKDRGGARLRAELEAFGCEVAESARRHHRICHVVRPAELRGIEASIEAGALRLDARLGAWTQPGVFSWDRLDAGTAFLISRLPPLAGAGADLGGGVGLLARAVLESPAVSRLDVLELDARACAAARLNLDDPRAHVRQFDLSAPAPLEGLDFVVTNPPFHAQGRENRGLGELFIQRAAAVLRRGGSCWLVANRHLAYEAVLEEAFSSLRRVEEGAGYKIYEAIA